MRADVAVGERAEDGVGQRVESNVGVRVADKAAVVRDRDAAEHDLAARTEGVDVVAGADADVAKAQHRLAGEAALGRGDVGGGRQLDVRRVAGNRAHRECRPIRQWRHRR